MQAATRDQHNPVTPDALLEQELLIDIARKLRYMPVTARDRTIRQLLTHAEAYEGAPRLNLVQNIHAYAHSQATLKQPDDDHTLREHFRMIGRIFNMSPAQLDSACRRGSNQDTALN